MPQRYIFLINFLVSKHISSVRYLRKPGLWPIYVSTFTGAMLARHHITSTRHITTQFGVYAFRSFYER